MNGRYIRFSDETNALDYLERASEFIKQTLTDDRAWKWVILSLHSALYGFAISACKHSDYNSVVRTTKKGVKKLITFDEALRMCKDHSRMATLSGGRPLNLSSSQEYSIKLLKKKLRNKFEHRIPGIWSIEIHGLPRISIDILDVVRFLTVETHRYQHLNQSQRRKIKSLVFQSKKLLRKCSLHLELLALEESTIKQTAVVHN